MGFTGHPTVGASWWLRSIGTPVHALQAPAGVVQVSYDDDITTVRARSDWSPEFAIPNLGSVDELAAAGGVAHYLPQPLPAHHAG